MKRIALMFVCVSLSSCGEGNFARNGETSEASSANVSDGTEVTPPTKDENAPEVPASQEDVTELPTAEEKQSLVQCAKTWGEEYTDGPVRKIKAAISILNSGYDLVDDVITSEPSTIIIYTSVNVLSTAEYYFGNPMGRYCIITQVNVLSDVTIKAHQNAALAGSKTQVSVGSDVSGENAATVGVNVLSDVTVERFQ